VCRVEALSCACMRSRMTGIREEVAEEHDYEIMNVWKEREKKTSCKHTKKRTLGPQPRRRKEDGTHGTSGASAIRAARIEQGACCRSLDG
jgi:hypothetical protein